MRVKVIGDPAAGVPDILGETDASGRVFLVVDGRRTNQVIKLPVNRPGGKHKIELTGPILGGKKVVELHVPPGQRVGQGPGTPGYGKPGLPKCMAPKITITPITSAKIEGTLKDANGNPIANKTGTVEVVKKGEVPGFPAPKSLGAEDVEAAASACQTLFNVEVTTDSTGKFAIDNLCQGLYDIVLHFPGSESIIKTAVSVLLGRVAQLDLLLQPGGMTLLGTVKDATTGELLRDVRVEVVGQPDKFTGTNGDGTYRLEKVKPVNNAGTVALRFTKEGYNENFVTGIIVKLGESVDLGETRLTPFRGGGEITIVTEWGASPRDLDANLQHPVPGSSSGRVHVSYQNRGDANSAASLDRDDTDGFGPETISIRRAAATGQFASGTYYYWVTNFSQEVPLNQSGAKVTITKGGISQSFTVPLGCTQRHWNALTFSVNGDGDIVGGLTNLLPGGCSDSPEAPSAGPTSLSTQDTKEVKRAR